MALERAPEIGLELQPFDGAIVHGRVEQRVAAAASRFRPVHRDVGVADEIVAGLGAGAADGNADARAGEHLVPAEHHRRRHGLLETLGHAHRIARVSDVLEQHRELVAADASQAVVPAVGSAAGRHDVVAPQHLGGRTAISSRRRSPAGCPMLSLTVLAIRSMKRTAN